MTKKPDYNQLYASLKDISIIIIDEFGFLGLETLNTIDSRLRSLWPDNNDRKKMSFGGFHILFVGDFMQLPPVKATALYTSIITINRITDTFKEKRLSCQGGYLSWHSINFALSLLKNYRTHDLEFQRILRSIRMECFSEQDYQRLMVCFVYFYYLDKVNLGYASGSNVFDKRK